MGKCLITKLTGIVNDDSIPKMSQLKVLLTKENSSISVAFINNVTLTTFGDVYFTDKTFTDNLGKTVSITQYENGYWGRTIYLKGKNGGVMLPLYDLLIFKGDNIEYDANRFVYNTNAVYRMNLDTLPSFDFAKFVKGKKIFSLSVKDTKTQNISCINDVVDITGLGDQEGGITMKGSSLYGDISVFNKFKEIENISVGNNTNINGEISQINTRFLSSNSNNVFTWKNTRPTTHKIMAIANINLGNDVDKMLIDQAACIVSDSDKSWNWKYQINVIGTRTSASDDAVSELQNKGYTILINPA